jgi:hypothetical protein
MTTRASIDEIAASLAEQSGKRYALHLLGALLRTVQTARDGELTEALLESLQRLEATEEPPQSWRGLPNGEQINAVHHALTVTANFAEYIGRTSVASVVRSMHDAADRVPRSGDR